MVLEHICIYVYVIHKIVHLVPLCVVSFLLLFLPPSGMLFVSILHLSKPYSYFKAQ